MGISALQNVFYNWNDVPNIDFDKPWWNETAINELRVQGVSFLAFSDMLISSYDNTNAMLFNKKLYADLGLTDNLYDVVREGKWTIDKLYEITKDMYRDLNGDGNYDDGDMYGLVSIADGATSWCYGFNHPITRVNGEGYPEIALSNEKSAQIAFKMYDCYFNTPSWRLLIGEKTKEGVSMWDYTGMMFTNNRAVFIGAGIGAGKSFRDKEEDFGLLPMPKWKEDQEKYHSQMGGHGSIMAIPRTSADNDEMIGTIMEALAAESNKKVIPAYYEITLKNKQLRDEESIEMLEIIRNGVLFEFGYVYDGWQAFGDWLGNLLKSKKSDLYHFMKRESQPRRSITIKSSQPMKIIINK
jgi:ABC-type glycerol-3-phosphate transport system substrate-binding protein